MAHMLIGEELEEFQTAFTMWDIDGDGTIAARDLGKLLQYLGVPPSVDVEMLYENPEAHSRRINFPEFMDLIAGPPVCVITFDDKEALLEAFATYIDDHGTLTLRDLMCAMDGHLKETGEMIADDHLAEIYLETLDVSMLGSESGDLETDTVRSIVADEFNALRREQSKFVAASSGSPEQKHTVCYESQDLTADCVVNVAVADLSGTPLMAAAFASCLLVAELHQHIETMLGLPAQRQALFLAGQAISRKDLTLSEVGVLDGMSLMLVVKEELKVDHRKFLKRLMEGYFEHRPSI